MRKIALYSVLVSSLVFIATMAIAGTSVETGKKLFNDTSLGGSPNAKSCNSCHPNGEKLENAGGKKNLVTMINRCIRGALKGEKIDDNSDEMLSLKMYIQSIGK